MSTGVGLLVVALLIAANALFVAAEFALVASRRTTLTQMVEEGVRGARVADLLLTRISFVLSACQFGITATSLLVGFLAEDAVGGVLRPLTEALGLPDATVTFVSITGAFLLSTAVQMVFGELAPKNLALALPERVAARTSGAMRAFGVVFGPLIRLFDGSAVVICRWFGIEVREELEQGLSPDELARVVRASGEEGSLTPEQTALLTRGIALGDRRVAEVIVPRPDVVWLDEDDPLVRLREQAAATGHSRFPVRAGSDDDVVGTVHVKDLIPHATDEDALARLTVGDVVAEALVVPEGETLRDLLRQLRSTRRTFAVVVDEYGGTAGIVTIEDVVEELVGDIADEFDRETPLVRRAGKDRYRVSGGVRPDRLAAQLDLELPEGDYETVAGFVLAELGRIPDVGDDVTHDGWRLTVMEMDGVRVAELQVRRDEPAPATIDHGAGEP